LKKFSSSWKMISFGLNCSMDYCFFLFTVACHCIA
jgi:hypothetical protein